MQNPSAKESARTLPRKWIDENWGFAPGTQHDQMAGRLRKVRARSAPTARRKDNGFVYHAYTGRRVPPGQQQQQQQGPLHRRPLIEDDTRVALADSWGLGGGPSFAPKGVGPLLEPPRPPKGPTKPCWPTRTIGASALRYVGIVRREKLLQGKSFSRGQSAGATSAVGGRHSNPQGAIDAPGLAGDVPTVSWPEHAAMETGDVVITVEHCHGCHRHRMTTRHDPEVYLRQANAVRELLVESLQESPIRLAVVLKKAIIRSKALPQGGRGSDATGGNASTVRQRRVGAFEVQVASRHPSRAHLLHVRVVHSKLASGRWPRLETDAHLPRRVKATLASWGFESNRRKAIGAGLDGEGADDETRSEHHRPPSRAHISWEFDNRNWLRCAAAPAVPSHESNTEDKSNPSNHSNNSHRPSKPREGRTSTPAPGNDDTKQRKGQAGPLGNIEDAGPAKCGLGDGCPPSGGSAGTSGSAAGAGVNEAAEISFGGGGRDRGGGERDGYGMSHASAGAGVAVDAGTGWECEAGSSDNASAVVASANTVRSYAVAKAPTTPPGLQRSGNARGAEGKERRIVESGLFQSVGPAASVDSSDGDIAATELAGLLADERGYDPNTEDLATVTDVGDVDRINTPQRSSRQHKGKGDDSPASGCEGSGETGCSSTPVRFVRGRQETRNSLVGEAQRTPRQTIQVAQQALNSNVRDESEADGSRASERIVGGNPGVAGGGAPDSDSVWSNNNRNSNSSSSSSSTGRNSPIQSSRGSPKTVGEANTSLENTATTSSGYDGQEKTTSDQRKGADNLDPHRGNGTAEKGAKFAQPNVSGQYAPLRNRGRGTGDEGGDSSDGSIASSTQPGAVNPTNKAATQCDPRVTQNGYTSDAGSRRSRASRETGEGGGGREGRTFGDSNAVGEESSASNADEDEYGSDFASQDASSVEEVDEGNDITEGAPPLMLPREDSGMGEGGEEFQWSDADQKETEEEEEEEEENEYGDDFDDDGGDFDSS